MTAPVTGFELAEIEPLPVELPRRLPTIPASTYEARIADALRVAREQGYEALVVWADREHFATLSYLTGYDPRFEESLFILVPGRTPQLLVGNEGLGYAEISPVKLDIVLYQTLSLVSQPRGSSTDLLSLLAAAGLGAPAIRQIGLVGTKYFTTGETAVPDQWFDVPAFVVDSLRHLGCIPHNAAGLFVDPDGGLRTSNDVDQLAAFEFAGTHGSAAVRRVLEGIRAGLTELEAASLLRPTGLPLSYHPPLLSGPRAALGLASPSDRELAVGDPMSMGFGYWGANTARSGFLVETAADLPEGGQDYLERLVTPYFATAVEWYETIGIGVPGGALFDLVDRRLGDPFFGVGLNPGHFIHLDEWPSSPVYRDSTIQLRSGSAVQLDIIPATGSIYHTSNIEDGVALADEPLREELAAVHPAAWARMIRRRDYMRDELGIRLKPEVLPLSDLGGYLPPFWLDPHRVLRRASTGS